MKKLFALLFIVFATNLILSATPKEYYITCDPADFAKIYKTYWEDIYIPITFTYEGKTWTDVEMRIRGDGSRALPKKSLKIKFSNEPFSNGREKLNFNAEYENRTYMNNILSSRLFKSTGHVCFDAEHAKLFLNGEFLGLYVRIENVDDDFLVSNNLDTEGNLYKATVDAASMSIYDKIDSLFEKKTNKKSGMEDLQELIDEVNSVNPADFYEFVQKTFEYDKLVNIIAVNLLLSNFSTYYHNYYLYHDIEGTGKWQMIPWDLDKTYYKYGYYLPYTYTSTFYSPDNPLIEKMQMNDKTFADIQSRITEIREKWFNSDFLNPIIDSLADDIVTTVEIDTTDNVDSLGHWEYLVNKTKIYVEARYDQLFDQFKTYPYNFMVERTPEVMSGEVTLRWNKAKSPNNEISTYNVYYNNRRRVTGDSVQVIMGITDTTVTLPDNLKNGERYRWFVEADNGHGIVDGTDNYNFFTYQKDNGIPCEISEDFTLTNKNSPYLIDCNIHVLKDATLTIEKGVKLIFKENAGLLINGALKIKGEADENVVFEPESYQDTYIPIEFNNTSGVNTIDYLQTYHSVLHIVNSETNIDNSLFDNKTGSSSYFFAFIKNENGLLSVKNTTFVADNSGGEGIVSYEKSTQVKNCSFDGIPDAIEYIRINGGNIENNIIRNSSDDAIDLNGCTNINILNNQLFNITDKGISVGLRGDTLSTDNIIRGNLVVATATAVAIKNSCSAHIINNTFVSNKTAVFYAENSGYSNPDTTVIENNIFYNSNINLESNDESTRKVIQYCLYSKGELPGSSNIMADPMFEDITNDDYHLKANSPCINAGNPDSQRDSDGSIADVGAFARENSGNPGQTNIIINEIMCKANPDADCGDWVELYNPTDNEITVSNWVLSDDNSAHVFSLPENTTIEADQYLIIAKNLDDYRHIYENNDDLVGGFDFGLGSSDEIRLYDNANNLIDSVYYDTAEGIFVEAAGTGKTLELIAYDTDNAQMANWGVSKNQDGTPLKCNSISDCSSMVTELDFANILTCPNPVIDENLDVKIDILKTGRYTLSLYDLKGRELYTFFNNKSLTPNTYSHHFNLRYHHIGTYMLKLSFLDENKEIIKKLILIGK